MDERIDKPKAPKAYLSPAIGFPSRKEFQEPERRLDIVVVFTSVEATIAALKTAAALTKDLNSRVKLVVLQLVPYPLPLENPPVPLSFSERRFCQIALQAPVETTVFLYLCRDRWHTLKMVLPPCSLVVVGIRRKWWSRRERTLARSLRLAGHQVILAETE